jgi:hypothetical protein
MNLLTRLLLRLDLIPPRPAAAAWLIQRWAPGAAPAAVLERAGDPDPRRAWRAYNRAAYAALTHTRIGSDRALQRELLQAMVEIRQAMELVYDIAGGAPLPPPAADDPFAALWEGNLHRDRG